MKTNALYFLLFASLVCLQANAQTLDWMKSVNTEAQNVGINDVCIDKTGNVIITGKFDSYWVYFDTFALYTNDADIYLTKYNSSGTVQWAVRYGSPYTDEAAAICTDTTGNIIWTGTTAGTSASPPGNFRVMHPQDATLLKYKPDGSPFGFLWPKFFLGDISCQGTDVTTDLAGNVYATGKFKNKIYFDPDTLNTWNGYDIYLVKYKPDGTYEWSLNLGGSGDDQSVQITTDGTNTIAVCGGFYGDFNFDWQHSLTQSNGNDGFIAFYDFAGNLIDGLRIGNSGNQICQALSFGPEGDLYVTGYYTDSMSVGSYSIVAPSSSSSVFVLRIGKNGTVKWLRSNSGLGSNTGQGIKVTDDGKFTITGTFSGNIQFDTLQSASTGTNSGFIATFDTLGNAINLVSFISQYAVSGYQVDCDANGAWAACGGYSGNVLNGNGDTLPIPLGQLDGYLVKGCPQPDLSIQSLSGNTFCINSSVVMHWNPEGCFYPGNLFIIELSDGSGGFSSPVFLDTIAGAFSPGSINLQIPLSTTPGSGYRIRVRSTNPAIIGSDNGSNLNISGTTTATLAISGNTTICPNGSFTTLTATSGFSAYTWSNGSVSDTAHIRTPGTYSVSVIDSSGCSLSVSVAVDQCVNTEYELKKNAYTVFPNPVSSWFQVRSEDNLEFSALLFSTEGKILSSQKGLGALEFDLQNMQPGLFFLRVTGKSGNQTFKVIHLK